MLPRALLVAALATVAVTAGCFQQLNQIQNARTAPGENARDFDSNAKYTKLTLEVHYVPGSEPNDNALAELVSTIGAVTPKGANVDVARVGDLSGSGASTKYTWAQIDDIEKAHRTRYSSGDTAVLYIAYLDGGSQDDTGNGLVLGAAYHGTSIVMFKGNERQISSSGGGILPSFQASEECLERAVLIHEFGHDAGLVNNGIPMVTPHEDSAHPKHSSNQQSVMYYAVENSASLTNIFTGGCDQIPYQYDANDKADIAAVR
ncbi:MAG: hypothetical protein ACYDCK_06315 [Thermoplasmatota archaeon]